VAQLPPVLPRVGDYVQWHTTRQPDSIALTLGNDRITYAQLAKRIDELARALFAAGVRKGDRVATLQTPHPDYLIAFLATASIGGIWLGLNPRYQLNELQTALTDADPAILLTRSLIGARHFDRELTIIREAMPGLQNIVVFDADPSLPDATPMREFLRAGEAVDQTAFELARQSVTGQDSCLIVYTSGSSGTPKGALLHHEAIGAISRAQNYYWPVDPFSIVNYFPINHVGCVVDCTMPCLVAGGTLHFMENFDARACLELMARERVTVWGSVPSAFQLQLDVEGFERYDLSATQLIVWGGAAMPLPLIERLRTVNPCLGTNYGMTETTGTITTLRPTQDLEVLANSVGAPIDSAEVRLMGAAGELLGTEAAGELQVRSPYNFQGYWRRPAATTAAFTTDRFFRTGDLAIRRPDGRYRLIGRLSDMYKSGGYNIYPREIEQVLETHPAVALAAVVPITDPLWQEVGIAFLQLKAGATSTAGEMEAYCRSRLAGYKLPKRFLFESQLPLLPIGKVDKRTLRERTASMPHAAL
jgi:acyl-CoA synthetase (AMP-forming)/AMP-acid ligase II